MVKSMTNLSLDMTEMKANQNNNSTELQTFNSNILNQSSDVHIV